MGRRAYCQEPVPAPMPSAEIPSLEEVHMLVGAVAGMAVLYELVSWAAHRELSQHLHSPSDVWLTAILMIVIGVPAAVSFPRLVRSFAFFVAVAAAVAASLAAYSNQKTYAVPLLGLTVAS